MRALRILFAGVVLSLVTLLWTSSAYGGSIQWSYQQIDSRIAGGPIAMSVGTGARWPKVFYAAACPHQVMAASQSPAGWLPQTIGSFETTPVLSSMAGQDGRVGVAWSTGQAIQFAQSNQPGWPASTVGTTAKTTSGSPGIAWLPGNRPVVAYTPSGYSWEVGTSSPYGIRVATGHNGQWETETISVGGNPVLGTYVDVAVDHEGYIGVAYNSGETLSLAMKDFYSKDWQITPIGPCVPGTISLAFGPDNEPAITYWSRSGTLSFATFDTIQGAWESSIIATDVRNSQVNVVFDRLGRPALSYATDTEVHYRINDGGGWADYLLPTGVDPQTGINRTPYRSGATALAFDYNNIPMIAYSSISGGIVLAYDPVAPEPATALLVLLGGVGLSRVGSHRERRPQ